MIPILSRLLLTNWQRKLIALVLASVIWTAVHHSMTATKNIHGIPVRVVNLAPNQTIEGMQPNGLLNRKITLAITGNRSGIDELSGKDFEARIDAANKPEQWVASISKKNLVSLNSSVDIAQDIQGVSPIDIIMRQNKLITERIPIFIAQPTGEAPKGYQFLDVWPYQLTTTVTGPEDVVRRLQAKGVKLTFHLNEITKEELELAHQQIDEVSFAVPKAWRKIRIPALSDTPIEIDDPQAKNLRIDFSKQTLIPIGKEIPVAIFFPERYSDQINPEIFRLAFNDFIIQKHGLPFITSPLFAEGVSRLFVDTVKEMLQVIILASPTQQQNLVWNIQFIAPQELENRYVSRIMSTAYENTEELPLSLREEVLRNRFRYYMNRFRLYTPKNEKLALKIEWTGNTIHVIPQN